MFERRPFVTTVLAGLLAASVVAIAGAPGLVLLGSSRTVPRIVRRGDTIGPLREPDRSEHFWRVEAVDDLGASIARSDTGETFRARIEAPSSRPPN